MDHSPQPADSAEQNIPDATESSPSVLTGEARTASTDVSVPNNQIESNVSNSIERAPPEQPPQGPSIEVLTKRGLKRFATGLIGQAVDAAKIGPLKDISDLIQDF
ncbi:unnamed protein product, partial [Rhizoctonia solani]